MMERFAKIALKIKKFLYFLIFRQMKLSSSLMLKMFLCFLMFRKTETPKKFLIFPETETLKNLLYFRKQLSELKK